MSRKITEDDIDVELRTKIATSYITGMAKSAIQEQYKISPTTLAAICRQDLLDSGRAMFAAEMRKAAVRGELKARTAMMEDAEMRAAKSTVKQLVDNMIRQAINLFYEGMSDPDFKPKSPEGILNSIQKLADTYGRIDDSGDIKPTAIEITITGVNPDAPRLRDAAVTVQLIETGPADCLPSPESTSTGSSPLSTSPTPETESSSEGVV